MLAQIVVCGIVRDVDPDHPGDVTETVLQSPEQFAAEMIVLPKRNDSFSGVERLDVVGVDPPLFPNRGLPAHCPGEQRWIAQMIVSGGDKELRNLPLVQVCADGKIAGSSERTEHQEDVLLLDQAARKFQRGRRIGFVVMGDEAHLAAVDPATLVDHLKIRRFGLSDRSECFQTPAIGHNIADTDFGVGHARFAHAFGDRAQRRKRHDDRDQRSSKGLHRMSFGDQGVQSDLEPLEAFGLIYLI